MDRHIKRISEEEFNSLNVEERQERMRHLETVTALEAHDIICHFAEMGFMFHRAQAILERASEELNRLEKKAIKKANIEPEYAIDRYGQKVEEPPAAATEGGTF